MEIELNQLYVDREAALDRGDATAYNALNARIGEVAAYMRAEVNLGLRSDPIFVTSMTTLLRINTYMAAVAITLAFGLLVSNILGVS